MFTSHPINEMLTQRLHSIGEVPEFALMYTLPTLFYPFNLYMVYCTWYTHWVAHAPTTTSGDILTILYVTAIDALRTQSSFSTLR